MNIHRVSVLGSGSMGRQIAAYLINMGLSVNLINMTAQSPEELPLEPLDYIRNPKNQLLFRPSSISQINYLHFSQAEQALKNSDMLIETIVEDLEIKKKLFKSLTRIVSAKTILASNTSSLSINTLSEVLSSQQRKFFIGLHFFTPVHSSRMVELIANKETDKSVLAEVEVFVKEILNKEVIKAKDVTGFLANRIGFYANHEIMARGEAKKWPIPMIDAISGAYIGRSKMGPYRLSDLTGIDVSAAAFNYYSKDERERLFFQKRSLPDLLLAHQYLGDKTNGGYYKKKQNQRYFFNGETENYESFVFPELDIFNHLKSKKAQDNFEVIFNSEDKIGTFMWESIRNVMYYAAINVGYACDSYQDIDKAMVWGYNWQWGPFEIWDLMGYERVKKRIEDEVGPLPKWIQERGQAFYSKQCEPQSVKLRDDLIDSVIWDHDQQSQFVKTSEQVLLLIICTPKSVITPGLMEDIILAIDYLQTNAVKGMVVANLQKNFSVGFDIHTMQNMNHLQLQKSLNMGQKMVTKLKHSSKPIVTAIHGHVLGGGAEIALFSPKVVAAADTFIGLTEVGVGLIPGGGGLTELADRVYRSHMSRYETKRELFSDFLTVAYGKVSKNAYDALNLGLLRQTDRIVRRKQDVLRAAIAEVEFLAKYGYIGEGSMEYAVLGSDFKAIIEGQLRNWLSGGFATEHDCVIARSIADVLAGGNVPLGTIVNQKYLLEIEKEQFMALWNHPKTQERMTFWMKNRRPLHN